jgi:hypothetical protein
MVSRKQSKTLINHRDLKYRERMFQNFVDETSPSFSADETFHSTVYLVTFDGRFLKDSAF